MTQPTEQERPADIREAAAFANKQKCLMDGGLGKPAYWKHAMIMLADEVDQLQKRVGVRGELCRAFEASRQQVEQERDAPQARVAELEKRVAIRGDFCRTLEAVKQQVEDERDGLAAKCAELESRLNDAATSLNIISMQAGKEPFMRSMIEVRSYARSRAMCAGYKNANQTEKGDE